MRFRSELNARQSPAFHNRKSLHRYRELPVYQFAAGGHNVDSGKVIERYYKSIDNIKELLDICDIMHVYDNTKSPERIIRKHKEELSIYPNEYWSEQDILGLME